MANMNEYMQAIIRALNIIYNENMLIVSNMANSDIDSSEMKKMDEFFTKAIGGVLKE